MGSWLLYGLGSETEDLPGFIVLTSAGKSGQQPVSARQWSAGFLPSKFQGIQFQSKGDAVHYIGSPEGVCQSTQRQVDRGGQPAQRRARRGEARPRDPDPDQPVRDGLPDAGSVPELTDFAQRAAGRSLDLYGVKQPGDGSFASNCLLARRLAERGVRFIQLYHRAWDHHGNLDPAMPSRRGGRRPGQRRPGQRPQAARPARRHPDHLGRRVRPHADGPGERPRSPHPQLLALDGRRRHQGGLTYGATDELGYRAVEDVVHVRDLHATLLYLCGIDHRRLSSSIQGLDVRLTGVDPGPRHQAILA